MAAKTRWTPLNWQDPFELDAQLSEEQRQATLELLPVKRFCSPEEVAHAVRFIASPLAGFITGEIIDMNGGLQFD